MQSAGLEADRERAEIALPGSLPKDWFGKHFNTVKWRDVKSFGAFALRKEGNMPGEWKYPSPKYCNMQLHSWIEVLKTLIGLDTCMCYGIWLE